MNEQDLRDCFAMFAMLGIVMDGSLNAIAYTEKKVLVDEIAKLAYAQSDAMLKARTQQPEPEEGIVAVKPRKRTLK